jgi:hypothetical protein
MAANLVTLAEYKAYAGILSDNQDAVINAIIPKVSALVKNYCRKTFVDYVNDQKVEYFEGGEGPCFFLKEYPVLSVISVEISYDYGQNYEELTEYTDWVYVPGLEAIKYPPGDTFPYYLNGYKVTYTAGYETLPEDLKLAVLDLVTYYVKNDMAVHSPKAPGTNSVQIEYITSTNLPAHIKRVLDLYMGSFD